MFINQILDGLHFINKPQRLFFQSLFQTMLICQSAINFLALARHSNLNERTFRRNFRKPFCFASLNRNISEHCGVLSPEAVAQDASFIKKSGNHTFGLDKFWNGSHSRVEKGLELSIISLIDQPNHASLALSAAQTPPNLAAAETDKSRPTRIDFYLQHFLKTVPHFPKAVKYLLADGFYAKLKFARRCWSEWLSPDQQTSHGCQFAISFWRHPKTARSQTRSLTAKLIWLTSKTFKKPS